MNCKCNCSSDYNYDVIGLCDITSIGDKGVLADKMSWTQITIPEVLNIPECKPDIEAIDRIYINVKIESSEVISTPTVPTRTVPPPSPEPGPTPTPPVVVPIPNEEGLLLTGRKLLVDGYLCQTIVYTAANCKQTVHSSHFRVPFCTYIVIPGNTDITLDKFCVKACIEDVFAKVLNPRSIFKNVTLFLQAIKVEEPTC